METWTLRASRSNWRQREAQRIPKHQLMEEKEGALLGNSRSFPVRSQKGENVSSFAFRRLVALLL
jgi:hypothetical protein